jgi:class 3 adenylate cyclase
MARVVALCFAFLGALVAWGGVARAGTLVLEGEVREIPVGPHLELAYDATGSATVSAIATDRLPWAPNAKEVPTFGYRGGTEWARVRIDDRRGPGAPPLYLDHASTQTDFLALYDLRDGDPPPARLGGDQVPLASWEIPGRSASFRIAPGSTTLLVALSGVSSKQLALHLRAESLHHARRATEERSLGLFFGVLLAMTAYNLVVAVVTRSRPYAFYVAYLGSFLVFYLGYAGYLTLLELPDVRVINWLSPYAVLFSVGSAVLFTVALLGIERGSFSYRLLMWPLRTIAALALVLPLGGYVALTRVGSAFLLTIVPSLIVVGVLAARGGSRPARYYLLAWGAFLGGTLLMVGRQLGFLPVNAFTLHAQPIGSSLEVILLSFALSDRIRSLQEKALATARAFRRFVPDDFLALLGQPNFEALTAGVGMKRDLTVLFMDIRDFTKRSERLGPEATFRFVNACLARFEPVVRAEGGFVDKFIGDAIMAIFPDDPSAALRAAEGLHRVAAELEASGVSPGIPLAIGVGVHRGPVMLGSVGHDERLEVTAIGDAVNVAARLESLTKTFGVGALVSEDAVAARGPGLRRVGAVRVKGRSEPIDLFEVLACCGTAEERAAKEATAETFQLALAAFVRGEMDEARDRFQEVVGQSPGDVVAMRYAKRAASYAERGLPSNFEGDFGAL